MSDLKMASFLASVEHKAYRMALFAVKHRDDALDIVQDAMLQLVQLAHAACSGAGLVWVTAGDGVGEGGGGAVQLPAGFPHATARFSVSAAPSIHT